MAAAVMHQTVPSPLSLHNTVAVPCHRPFEVEWTGAAEGARFDIDLYYCDSYSFCFDVSGLVPQGFRHSAPIGFTYSGTISSLTLTAPCLTHVFDLQPS